MEGDEAAERVADDVCGDETRAVQRPLDRVGEQRVVDLSLDRRSARMAGERDGEHVVRPLERRQDELPRPPGVREAVQAEERRPAAAAVAGVNVEYISLTLTAAVARAGCRRSVTLL